MLRFLNRWQIWHFIIHESYRVIIVQLICLLIYVPLRVLVFLILGCHVLWIMFSLFGQLFGATLSNLVTFVGILGLITYSKCGFFSKWLLLPVRKRKMRSQILWKLIALNFLKTNCAKFCGWCFRRTYLAVQSSFHFSTFSLKLKTTDFNFYIENRLLIREVFKYERVNALRNLVPVDACNEVFQTHRFLVQDLDLDLEVFAKACTRLISDWWSDV